MVARDGKLTLYPLDEDGEAWDEEHGVEVYTPKRVAEFRLNNAIDQEDYEGALAEVRRLGVDPMTVPHDPPRQ